MKLLAFTTLLAASLFLFSCQKEAIQKPVVDYYIKATKNDVAWVTDSEGFKITQNTDTLTIGGAMAAENLLITLKKNSQGQYMPVVSNTAFFTLTTGDVITSSYALDSKAVNTITVTEVDKDNEFVKGTFNLTFKKIKGDNSLPSKVIFNAGEFYVSKYSIF